MIFFVRIEESKDESERPNSADNDEIQQEDVTIDENSDLLGNGKDDQGIKCASGCAAKGKDEEQGNKGNGDNAQSLEHNDEISNGNELEKDSEPSKNDSNANPDSKTSIMDGKGCVKRSKDEYETFEIVGLDPEAVRMIFGAVAGFQGNIEGCQSFIVLEQMYQVDQIF